MTKPSSLSLISWNVNGIRAVINKDALQPLFDLDPDILCLQETKACAHTIPELDFIRFPYRYFNHAEKKGYSGTAILSKREPLNVTKDFPKPKYNHPHEGRLLTAEFHEFFLVNAYVPNSKHGLTRLPYRDKEWDPDFRNYLKKLAKKKPVIACGDFNVAHTELDIANPQSNRINAGFTAEERRNFSLLLGSGFVDTFRYLHPDEPDHYSWWSFRSNARERNIGWRIDYFIVSKNLTENIKDAAIHTDLFGSDHAPVSLTINTP